MKTQRWFNFLVIVALVITLAVTVREVTATSVVISDSANLSVAECNSLPARYSIHTEYVEEADMWVIRSENGPTGVDGGLTAVLSAYETCSH